MLYASTHSSIFAKYAKVIQCLLIYLLWHHFFFPGQLPRHIIDGSESSFEPLPISVTHLSGSHLV